MAHPLMQPFPARAHHGRVRSLAHCVEREGGERFHIR
jgi:hypothetical protein